ncbi:MAG TPA: prepilin-type N-terminal cleavage/methylation domain-containing protein [Kofleriaceae bacterium]|nr:prepilin-type N-terminal cleavage/methylation domain-containing protein [Kofleriaceae bacterium]
MNRTRQRGFTLIELMVALLVSSLLVGMILAIFSRMSLAYRSQQQVAGLQQILAAARATIELDAKQAGLGVPQGFKIAGPSLQSPVQIKNNVGSLGPDQIAFFYADTSISGMVSVSNLPASPTITLADTPVGFVNDMLVVLTTASTAANPLGTGTNPDVATYDACVLRIASVNTAGKQITFYTTAPWGASPAPAHCTNITAGRTMMYHFIAHAYQIDPTPGRLAIGVLQQTPTGNLTASETWNDLAYGFSDIQAAVRVYDPAGTDLDGDTDAVRNWYSAAGLDTMTSLATAPAGSSLLGMSISLVAHTDRNVEGIASSATPKLLGTPTANNSLGDHDLVALPASPANALLPDQRIYRYTTFQIDFRNLGVGVGQ